MVAVRPHAAVVDLFEDAIVGANAALLNTGYAVCLDISGGSMIAQLCTGRLEGGGLVVD